jgi:hypothetical protein
VLAITANIFATVTNRTNIYSKTVVHSLSKLVEKYMFWSKSATGQGMTTVIKRTNLSCRFVNYKSEKFCSISALDGGEVGAVKLIILDDLRRGISLL